MIDWVDILIDSGLEIPKHSDEFSIVCPFHDDQVSSCSINIDKKILAKISSGFPVEPFDQLNPDENFL